ncbi:hypothetical protein L1049_015088 [Liquidambar formosana]|uniref:Aminotransferase-like plant mobile domain-containing protein n=1 Tax=Liquidambar formosana TaxID=63359 RepID=A0AAP0RXE0_LIQFO
MKAFGECELSPTRFSHFDCKLKHEVSASTYEHGVVLYPYLLYSLFVVVPRYSRHRFYGLSHIAFIRLDPALITALVEHWRQETHTFHFPIGEVAITFQVVAVLWGLPIDGLPITSSKRHRATHEWQWICQDLLGRTPPNIDISGGTLRIGWITEHFTALPDGAPAELVVQFARVYMLHLIGGIMLLDKSQNRVQLMFLPLLEYLDQIHMYSWGSACLARLYRELCHASSPDVKDIGGALLLLQLWAWERLPRLVPHMPPGVVPNGLQPIVIDEENSLPPGPYGCRGWSCGERSRHLFCFDVIEWHFPNRVLRQFGLQQLIPGHCDTDERLHTVDRQGKPEIRWAEFHAQYLQM